MGFASRSISSEEPNAVPVSPDFFRTSDLDALQFAVDAYGLNEPLPVFGERRTPPPLLPCGPDTSRRIAEHGKNAGLASTRRPVSSLERVIPTGLDWKIVMKRSWLSRTSCSACCPRLGLLLQPPRLSAKDPIEEEGSDSHEDPPFGDLDFFDHMGIMDESDEDPADRRYPEGAKNAYHRLVRTATRVSLSRMGVLLHLEYLSDPAWAYQCAVITQTRMVTRPYPSCDRGP